MTFINSGYMVGLLIGSMAFGVISDKFGRRKALILGAVMSGCISVAQSFVKNYWLGLVGIFGFSFFLFLYWPRTDSVKITMQNIGLLPCKISLKGVLPVSS